MPLFLVLDGWIPSEQTLYTMEYYSVIRKDNILPFETIWMNLEKIMLSKMSDKKNHTHMWDIKLKATNEQTKEQKYS